MNESKKKILIVDDSASIRSTVSEVLVDAGYQVLEASNGLEGLVRVETEAENQAPIDLVLLDVQMPECSGPELMEALLKMEGRPQVIMMTGMVGSVEMEEVAALNCDGVLAKPLSVSKLLQVIGMVLGG